MKVVHHEETILKSSEICPVYLKRCKIKGSNPTQGHIWLNQSPMSWESSLAGPQVGGIRISDSNRSLGEALIWRRRLPK